MAGVPFSIFVGLNFFFFFWFLTVFSQNFQPEINHCSRRVGPWKGKVLIQEILFKVQVAGLELGSTPNRAQYKHLETKSPSNSAKPLGWLNLTYARRFEVEEPRKYFSLGSYTHLWTPPQSLLGTTFPCPISAQWNLKTMFYFLGGSHSHYNIPRIF